MKAFILPYFDSIDIDHLEDYYEAEIELNSQEDLSVGLNLDAQTDISWNNIKEYLDVLPETDKKLREQLKELYPKGGFVQEFIFIQAKELSENEDFIELLEENQIDDPTDPAIFSILEIESIELYPNEENFAVWYFTFNCASDDVLTVYSNKQGEIIDTCIES